MKPALVVLAGLAILAGATPGRADEPGSDILMGGESINKFKTDRISGHDGHGGIVDVHPELEESLFVNIGPHFRLNATAKLEPVREPGRKNRYFQDLGAWMEKLTVAWDADPVSVYAGKFTLPFGIGWDKAPGIYGDEWAKDYEFSERLGVGAEIALPVSAGRHVVNLAAFRRDTSFLSGTLFAHPDRYSPRVTRPGQLQRRDGGLANTDGLDSWLAGVSGSKIPWIGEWSYGLAVESQAGGLPGEQRETGWVATLSAEFKPTRRLTVTPLAEYVHFDKYQTRDARADYLMLGTEATWMAWSVSLVGQWRDVVDRRAGTSQRDRFVTAAVGYDLAELVTPGLSVAVAARRVREAGDDYAGVGLELTYSRKF